MEVSKVDNKSGLRELIEMRNKRTKESSSTSATSTTTTSSSNKNKSDHWLSTVKSLYDKSSTDPGPFSANNSNSASSPVDEDIEERGHTEAEGNGAPQIGGGPQVGGGGGDLPRLRLRVDGDKFTNLNTTGSASLLAKNLTSSKVQQKQVLQEEEEEGAEEGLTPDDQQMDFVQDNSMKKETTNNDDNNGDILDGESEYDEFGAGAQSGDSELPAEEPKSDLPLDASDLPSQSGGDYPSDMDLNTEVGANNNPMEDEEMDDDEGGAEEEQQQTASTSNAIEDPQPQQPVDPNVWTLPAVKEDCTLEEIRRGQVVNKKASNECPVMGCGKLINEARAEPMPGTIAAGLRTHVLFVHYQSNRLNKRRKLGWSRKRPGQPSPRKLPGGSLPAGNRLNEFDLMNDGSGINSSVSNIANSGLSFARRSFGPISGGRQSQGSTSLINKSKPARFPQKPLTSQPFPMSSLQSLIQATGGAQLSPHAQQQQLQQLNLHNQQQQPQAHQRSSSSNNNNNDDFQKTMNNTTSSLFSILTSLTQQPPQQQANQPQQQQPPVSRIAKTAHNPTNTINVSQCSRSSNSNSNGNNSANSSTMRNGPPVSSSLLSLLNEKITGNVVANSLQNQLNSTNQKRRQQQSSSPPNTASIFPSNNGNFINLAQGGLGNNDPNFGGAASILNGLCAGNSGDNRASASLLDNSTSLNSFIRSIAARTDSNLGPNGLSEVKRIIEKFTTSLLCSSQTIADHYVASFDTPQQKQEISASDVQLAYKMMQKTQM